MWALEVEGSLHIYCNKQLFTLYLLSQHLCKRLAVILMPILKMFLCSIEKVSECHTRLQHFREGRHPQHLRCIQNNKVWNGDILWASENFCSDIKITNKNGVSEMTSGPTSFPGVSESFKPFLKIHCQIVLCRLLNCTFFAGCYFTLFLLVQLTRKKKMERKERKKIGRKKLAPMAKRKIGRGLES